MRHRGGHAPQNFESPSQERGHGSGRWVFSGHPVLDGHTEGQRDKQTNGTVCWVTRKGHGKERRRQAGRRRPGARSGCLLIGREGRAERSGPVAGSDPQPKQTYLRGLGAIPSPHRWNQRQTGTLQGPAVTPGPKLSKAH